MDHKFHEVIACIKNYEELNEKLMIFAYYFEIYNGLVRHLKLIDEKEGAKYSQFLRASFKFILGFSKFENQNSYETIMKKYINFIWFNTNSQKYLVSNLTHYNNHIDFYKREMIYVDEIDRLDLDFATKADALMYFRLHYNVISIRIGDTFGDSAGYEISSDVMEYLTMLLPNLLEGGLNENLFSQNLKDLTRIYIESQIEKETLPIPIYGLYDPKFLGTLDDIENEVLKEFLPYFLAGYKLTVVDEIMLKDVSTKIGIPPEKLNAIFSFIKRKFVEYKKDIFGRKLKPEN